MSSTGGQAAFYGIAATLIPLLLFGGVAVERLRPNATATPARILASLITIYAVGYLAVIAEIIAILVLVTGESNLLFLVIVVVALVAGMYAIVAAIAWPWVALAGTLAKKRRLAIAALGILSFVPTATLSVLGVVQLVDNASSLERSDANIAEQDALLDRSEQRTRYIFSLGLKLLDRPPPTETQEELLQSQIAAELKQYGREQEQIDDLILEGANIYRDEAGLPLLNEPIYENPERGEKGGPTGGRPKEANDD